MTEQQNCQGCNQKQTCQDIYKKLANLQSWPMLVRVIVAFLLPIAVFVASLAIFERVFAKIINSKQSRTVIGFLVALSISFCVMLIAKVINRQFDKNK